MYVHNLKNKCKSIATYLPPSEHPYTLFLNFSQKFSKAYLTYYVRNRNIRKTLCFVVWLVFGDTMLLCSPGWPQTEDSPILASQLLGLYLFYSLIVSKFYS
jgi:hypothetical protein